MIIEIAQHAGIQLHGNGDKRQLCCPLHDDQTPSAFVSVPHNVFYCSVCTPGGGWTAKKFAESLRVPWVWRPSERSDPSRTILPRRREPPAAPACTFGPKEAAATWETARARAYNDRWDTHIPVDHAVYDYLRSRRLEEAWETRAFGILSSDQPLHYAVRQWPGQGYQLIAPVYDQLATLVNVQARAILPREPKTLFPKGSRVSGAMFATREGVALLRGSWTGSPCAVLGEGMTDYLALSTVCPAPTLCSPGTGTAAKVLGPWVDGCSLLVAVDVDRAGENATAPIARKAFEFGARAVRRLVWPRHSKDACDALLALGALALSEFLEAQLEELVQ